MKTAIAAVVTKNCLNEFLLAKFSCDQFNDVNWYVVCDLFCFDYITKLNYKNITLIPKDLDDSIANHNSKNKESNEKFNKIVLEFFTAIKKALESNKTVFLIGADELFTGTIEDNIIDLLDNKRIDFATCPHYTNDLRIEHEFGYYNTGLVGINDVKKIEIWEKLCASSSELGIYYDQKPFEMIAKNYSCLSLPINYNIGWWKFNQPATRERIKKLKLVDDQIYFGNLKAINFHMHIFKSPEGYNPGSFLVNTCLNLMKASNNEKYKNIINYHEQLSTLSI